eukprot:196687-Amorphochlora_amoeboformis.AAC.1
MRLYGTFPSGQRRGVGNARTPSLKKNAGQHRAQPASSVGSFGDAREPLPRGSPGDSGEFEGGIDPQNCSSPEGQSGVMRLGVGFRKGLGICARNAGTIAVFVVLVPVFCLASRVWILEFGPHHVRNPVNFDDVLLYPNGKSSPSNPADYINRDTAPKLHEWEYARHVDPSPPRRTKLFSVGKGAEGHLPSTDTILPQPISGIYTKANTNKTAARHFEIGLWFSDEIPSVGSWARDGRRIDWLCVDRGMLLSMPVVPLAPMLSDKTHTTSKSVRQVQP